ncbi:MAG: AraC family transcriptional regulator [Prevotella sp.]|jgi:AraC-like DNA-binding protein|nr:AraC family transcriptional regulator [Prevotella sp.]
MSKAPLIRVKYSLATLDVANDEIPSFYNPLHYHPELELTYIEQSSGMRIVGDSIESFQPGDLVLVGSKIPHIWKNDIEYINGKAVFAKAVVIKFLPDFAGNQLWNIPEMDKIRSLIYDLAPYGFKLEGATKDIVAAKMKILLAKSPAKQIIHLLEILDIMSEAEKYRLLSKFQVSQNEKDGDKINLILSFLQTNFARKISLKNIADKACMHQNSLCTYFKKETGKTIFDVLHEIRLKQACHLLLTTDDSIAVISSKVGFYSQTLFNRKFKEVCGTTPLLYRKKKKLIDSEEEW